MIGNCSTFICAPGTSGRLLIGNQWFRKHIETGAILEKFILWLTITTCWIYWKLYVTWSMWMYSVWHNLAKLIRQLIDAPDLELTCVQCVTASVGPNEITNIEINWSIINCWTSQPKRLTAAAKLSPNLQKLVTETRLGFVAITKLD